MIVKEARAYEAAFYKTCFEDLVKVIDISAMLPIENM